MAGAAGKVNLNGTMPVMSSNFNFVKVLPGGNEASAGKSENQSHGLSPNGPVAKHDSIETKAVSDKINLEAYQAYYNTNEGAAQN